MRRHLSIRLRRSGMRMTLLLLAVVSFAPARAGNGTSCFLSITPLAFGKYVPFASSPSDFTATIMVNCTTSSALSVPIHGTIILAGADGPFSRRLNTGSHSLRYQLYLDPARTLLWGDGNGGSGTGSVSGTVSENIPFRQILIVYGRIQARQSYAHVDTYADQIIAVLNY